MNYGAQAVPFLALMSKNRMKTSPDKPKSENNHKTDESGRTYPTRYKDLKAKAIKTALSKDRQTEKQNRAESLEMAS